MRKGGLDVQNVESLSAPKSVIKPKKFYKTFQNNKHLWLMMVVPLLYYLVFCYGPMYGLIIAFEDYSPFRGMFAGPWVGFKNFMDFFNSVYFFRLIKNTVLLNVFGVLWGFPAPIILAFVINSLKFKLYRNFTQTLSYLPHFISTVVIVGMAMNFLSPTSGVINQLIVALGGKATNFMVLPQYFRTIYIASGVWQEMGWESIIYLAALSGVDPQLYEAAKIDGANKFKQLTHITIPTILPTIIILFILRMGNMMSIGAEKVLLLYNPLTYSTGDVINTYVYRVGIGNNQMSYGAAVGFFQSVINCVIIFSVNKICRKFSEVSLW